MQTHSFLLLRGVFGNASYLCPHCLLTFSSSLVFAITTLVGLAVAQCTCAQRQNSELWQQVVVSDDGWGGRASCSRSAQCSACTNLPRVFYALLLCVRVSARACVRETACELQLAISRAQHVLALPHPADLWHRLDRVEAVDWEAAFSQEDDKGVTRAQRHRIPLGQLDEGVIVAVEADLAAWTRQQETQSNRRSTRTQTGPQTGEVHGQQQEHSDTCMFGCLHAATHLALLHTQGWPR